MIRFVRMSALAVAGGLLVGPSAEAGEKPGCAACGPLTPRAALRALCQPPPPAPPNGFFVYQWYDAQIAKAEQQKLFIQPHEWYLGGTSLGPAGRRHLDRLARALLDGTERVFVEPSTDDKLNAARVAAVMEQLVKYGVKDAEKRVYLAYPLGEGLYAEDASRAYQRLFQSRGFGGGATGAGFGGGLSGGGLGGLGGGLGGFGGIRGY